MENFREKLKFQNFLIAIGAFVLAAVSVLGACGVLKPIAGDSHWVSMWNGFISGASFGVLAVMIAILVRNIMALTSEKQMKKVYVQETDERSIQIWTNARAAAMQTFMLVGLVAGMVAGYFSIAVSITIVACVFCTAITGLFFKFYYSMKF